MHQQLKQNPRYLIKTWTRLEDKSFSHLGDAWRGDQCLRSMAYDGAAHVWAASFPVDKETNDLEQPKGRFTCGNLKSSSLQRSNKFEKKTQSKKLHFQAVIKARLDHGSKVVLFDSSHGLKILLQWSH